MRPAPEPSTSAGVEIDHDPFGWISASGRWLVVSGAILVIGVGCSLAAAFAWRSSLRTQSRQEFRTTVTEVTATVEAMLRRDTDLIATLRGVLTEQPDLSQTGFDRVYEELEGSRRETGTIGTTVVKDV